MSKRNLPVSTIRVGNEDFRDNILTIRTWENRKQRIWPVEEIEREVWGQAVGDFYGLDMIDDPDMVQGEPIVISDIWIRRVRPKHYEAIAIWEEGTFLFYEIKINREGSLEISDGRMIEDLRAEIDPEKWGKMLKLPVKEGYEKILWEEEFFERLEKGRDAE